MSVFPFVNRLELQSIIDDMPSDGNIAVRVKEMVESTVKPPEGVSGSPPPFRFLKPGNPVQPVDLAKFFRYLNATDSVKDGANQYVAQEVFLNSFDDVTVFITPEKFKAFVRLHLLDDFTKVKKLCYTRIKGNDHGKPILPKKKPSSNTKATLSTSHGPTEVGIQEHDMTHVFYDCGFLPEKIINMEGVLRVETLGNKFDTGPSNSQQTKSADFPVEDTVLTEAVMDFQGFQHSHISFTGIRSNNTSGKSVTAKSLNKSKSSEPEPEQEPHTCTTLQFRGFKYKNPETAINQFRIGNAQKSIALQGSIGLAQKSGFLMFKALQDRLMVLYYYFYCKMNDQQKCCLFTCDLVVAFCCYLFGQSFVYNQNDKQSKVTGLYWYNKDTIVDQTAILNKERQALVTEYDVEIDLINSLNSSNFTFSGGVKIENNILVQTVNSFKEHLKRCLQRVIDELNAIDTDDVNFMYNWLGTDTGTTNSKRVDELTKNIKSYKLMSLFQRDKSGKIRQQNNKYVFISTRFQVCIADKLGYTYNPVADDNTEKGQRSTPTRKRNLYEVFNQFKPTNATSVTTTHKGGVSLIYSQDNLDGIYESNPDPEFPENVQTLYPDPMSAEQNLFMFIKKLYNAVLTDPDIINSKFADEVLQNLFNNGVVTDDVENSPSEQTAVKQGSPPESSHESSPESSHESLLESSYNYGHIYDVFTYHFYADPDYTDENIANIMAQIIVDTGEYGSTEIDYKLQEILKQTIKQTINMVAAVSMPGSVTSTSVLNAKDESKKTEETEEQTKKQFPDYDEVASDKPISEPAVVSIIDPIDTAVEEFSRTVSEEFKQNGNLNNDDKPKLQKLNETLNGRLGELGHPNTFTQIFNYNGGINKFTNDNYAKHIMQIPPGSVYTNILTGLTPQDRTSLIVDIDTRRGKRDLHNNFLFGYDEAMYAYITGKQFKTNTPLTHIQRERLLYYLYDINGKIEGKTHDLRPASAGVTNQKAVKAGKRTRKIRRKTNKNMRTTERRRSVGVLAKDNVKKYRKTRRRNKIRNHKCGIPGQAKQSTRKEFLTS
jgi:hypothetical protein